MIKLFGAIFVAFILWQIIKEVRKNSKREELQEGLHEELEQAEDSLAEVHVKGRVLDVKETVAQKQEKLDERAAKLNKETT